uniref:CSON010655 protein n=1 Tax=Culicoides sonorensis TaxID=179676 RepID=A0A336M5W6_CULSO
MSFELEVDLPLKLIDIKTYFGSENVKKKQRRRRRKKRKSCKVSFNLPRVTAQLEKLMGTNVVRLTDRKYMQELQKRIKEDYCATLEKRIDNRVNFTNELNI